MEADEGLLEGAILFYFISTHLRRADGGIEKTGDNPAVMTMVMASSRRRLPQRDKAIGFMGLGFRDWGLGFREICW
jgi:hypothetical protein